MKKILIIAEKQTIADCIKSALMPKATKGDGCYVQDHLTISWARGHIIKPVDDATYTHSERWDMQYLPIIPKPFLYEPYDDVKHYIKRLKSLINEHPIIINACDDDREGELIFGLIFEYFSLDYFSKSKELYRMKFSSVLDSEIRQSYENKIPLADVYPKFLAGKARLLSDWLVGINATQCFTLLNQAGKLSLGRVQTPLLKLICERTLLHKSHKESFTYKIQIKQNYSNTEFTATSMSFDTKEEATQILNSLQQDSIVYSFEQKELKQFGPLLYNLSEIQKSADAHFGFDADKTLDILQSLYEKSITSYPRTEDPYITPVMFQQTHKKLIAYAQSIINAPHFDKAIQMDNISMQSVKEELKGHHALIFNCIPYDFSTLHKDEFNIIKLIAMRILETFALPETYITQKVILENQGQYFACRTRKSLVMGFKNLSQQDHPSEEEQEDIPIEVLLPNIPLQTALQIFSKDIQAIKSKPKPLFTTKTLLTAMEQAGKGVDISYKEHMKGKGLGRPAVRDGIIKKLYDIKYIQKVKNNIIPTELGLKVYKQVGHLLISNIELTCKVEEYISFIEEGRITFEEFMTKIEDLTHSIFSDLKQIKNPIQSSTEILCPKCKKGYIKLLPIGATCTLNTKENKLCDFMLFSNVFNKSLSEKDILTLITKGRTGVLKGFKNKDNKPFEAALVLDMNTFKISPLFHKK